MVWSLKSKGRHNKRFSRRRSAPLRFAARLKRAVGDSEQARRR